MPVPAGAASSTAHPSTPIGTPALIEAPSSGYSSAARSRQADSSPCARTLLGKSPVSSAASNTRRYAISLLGLPSTNRRDTDRTQYSAAGRAPAGRGRGALACTLHRFGRASPGGGGARHVRWGEESQSWYLTRALACRSGR